MAQSYLADAKLGLAGMYVKVLSYSADQSMMTIDVGSFDMGISNGWPQSLTAILATGRYEDAGVIDPVQREHERYILTINESDRKKLFPGLVLMTESEAEDLYEREMDQQFDEWDWEDEEDYLA